MVANFASSTVGKPLAKLVPVVGKKVERKSFLLESGLACGVAKSTTGIRAAHTLRERNAARNILKVAGGQPETKNGRGGRRKTTAKVAASCEASTNSKYVQLSLF